MLFRHLFDSQTSTHDLEAAGLRRVASMVGGLPASRDRGLALASA